MYEIGNIVKNFQELENGDIFISPITLSLYIKVSEYAFYDVEKKQVFTDETEASVIYIGKLEEHLTW